MVLFAESDLTTLLGGVALALTNLVTLYFVFKKKRRADEIEQDEVDQDKIDNTVEGWRGLMKERQTHFMNQVKELKSEVQENKKEIKTLQEKERQCAENAIRQEAKMDSQQECINDLNVELKALKAILEVKGIKEGSGELQSLPPGLYPTTKYQKTELLKPPKKTPTSLVEGDEGVM